MSHFTVLVIGKNPEEQLAPFNENIEMPRYVKYTKQQLIDKEREDIERYKNGTYAEYLKNPEAYIKNAKANPGHITYITEDFPKKLNWTDEQLYQEAIKWLEPEEITPEGGQYSTSNPNAKWDWYQLGGRWTGFFKLKEKAEYASVGTPSLVMPRSVKKDHADQAFKRDIDFEFKRNEQAKYAADRFDLAASILKGKNHKTFDELLKKYNNDEVVARDEFWKQPSCVAWRELEKEMGHREFPFGLFESPDTYHNIDREKYIQDARNSAITTHAVLWDGKWYEHGEMGWWAIVIDKDDNWDEKFSELLDSIPDDELISLYDCHI